jgi:DNA polymerase/3'-5' exonuclease PolX
MNYTHAFNIADYLKLNLQEHCLPGYCRVAGSVRRKKAECGDLEFVVIPAPGHPRPEFGQKRIFTSHLDLALYQMECADTFTRRVLDGPREKKFVVNTRRFGITALNDFNFEIYIVRPETWGVQFVIRTGSADFSHKCVTPRKFGGYLPDDCKVHDGRVWRYRAGDVDLTLPLEEIAIPLKTLEERDFLDLLELGWIEPEARK